MSVFHYPCEVGDEDVDENEDSYLRQQSISMGSSSVLQYVPSNYGHRWGAMGTMGWEQGLC